MGYNIIHLKTERTVSISYMYYVWNGAKVIVCVSIGYKVKEKL